LNYLAHLYLTKDYPWEVSLGNFFADAVKGNNAISKYPENIQTGIRIHREIDDFTDKHPLVSKGKKRLYGNYGKFAGIIVDIYFDHILALNWKHYSDISLEDFAQSQYDLITSHWNHLPERTRFWYHYMHQNNLLVNYAREDIVEMVLQRMDKRMGSISGMGKAIEEFRIHKPEYTNEFRNVFQEIQDHLFSRFPQPSAILRG
jgi:acyl carrier protein phosphodiesterase